MDKPVNISHNNERLVYHYTTLETLFALIKGMKDNLYIFHASGLHYMNDFTEFAYGFKELRKLLPALENKIGITDDQIRISTKLDNADQYLQGRLNYEFVNTLIEGNMTPFTISTSSLGDSIPMWAMYGNAGRGVALGLDISNLYVRTKSNNSMTILDSTQYDWESPHAYKVMQQLSLGHPAIQYAKSIYTEYQKKVQNVNSEKELGELCLKALYNMSLFSAALIKHPAFKFENEWRILSLANSENKPCYKINSKGYLTSYLAVKIPMSVIRRIVIGPCCDKNYQYSMVKGLLQNNNLSGCKIVYSKVPYRG